MNQFNDDAWIQAREEMIERMWTEELASASHCAELGEDDLPF